MRGRRRGGGGKMASTEEGPELNTTYNDINWINSSFDGGLALGNQTMALGSLDPAVGGGKWIWKSTGGKIALTLNAGAGVEVFIL